MAETNTPEKGIGLTEAQNAISAMFAPEEDTAEAVDALQTETEEVEVEMAEEEAGDQPEETEAELEEEDGFEEEEDQSFDLLTATVEVDGEEMTVDDLRKGHLRHRDYTRKTQEVAEQRRALTEAGEELQREREQYSQLLPALRQQIENNQQPEPDWDTLYDTDPTMAAKAERQWKKQQEDRQVRLQAISAEQARLNEAKQAQMQSLQQRYIEEQRGILPEVIPEWRDTKVAAKEAEEVHGYLVKQGFTDEDISGLVNATMVKLARNAMLYEKGISAADGAKKKPKKPRAKTLKAGSRSSVPRPKSAAQQAQQRLQQTGRVKHAAAAISEILNKG